MQGSHSFPLERALMLRERAAGTYYVSSYFLAKTMADVTVQIFSPVSLFLKIQTFSYFAHNPYFAHFVLDYLHLHCIPDHWLC